MHLSAWLADGSRVGIDLPAAGAVTVGRDAAADLTLPGDAAVSRRHATARLDRDTLRIDCEAAARNGLLVVGRDEAVRSATLRLGESAVIGRTRLSLQPGSVADGLTIATDRRSEPDSAVAIDPLPPRLVAGDDRLAVLARLPAVLDAAITEPERLARVAALVLVGVKAAATAAIVRRDVTGGDVTGGDTTDGPLLLDAWEQRTTAGPSVSRSLVDAALQSAGPIVHRWDANDAAGFTAADAVDWAIAVPIDSGTAIVVDGRGEADLRSEAKFIELVGQLLKAQRDSRRLIERLAGLRSYFAPPIMRLIERSADDDALLAPRECELAVLMADLAGYSTRVEAADDLIAELHRVRAALAIMTGAVLDHGGVTGEFLGDAVLGFWGWPVASDPADCAAAAVAIAGAMAAAGCEVGIGLAYGPAVAGAITTGDRTSINAFGPPLNTASRLQTLSRSLGLATVADESFRRACPTAPLRLVDRVRPRGLQDERPIYTLDGGVAADGGAEAPATDAAVASLLDGDVVACRAALDSLAPGTPNDPVVRLLRRRLDAIAWD